MIEQIALATILQIEMNLHEGVMVLGAVSSRRLRNYAQRGCEFIPCDAGRGSRFLLRRDRAGALCSAAPS